MDCKRVIQILQLIDGWSCIFKDLFKTNQNQTHQTLNERKFEKRVD